MIRLVAVGPSADSEPRLLSLLHRLPDWFGQPAATAAYGRRAAELPGVLAFDRNDCIGALFLEPAGDDLEIHVMAVDPARHRRGIGRSLVEAALGAARVQGRPRLLVKTLSAAHPDPHYAATRRFYEAAGFRPLAELPDEWGAANPCLLMGIMVGGDGIEPPTLSV